MDQHISALARAKWSHDSAGALFPTTLLSILAAVWEDRTFLRLAQ